MASLHILLGDLTGWSLFLPEFESDPQSWSEDSERTKSSAPMAKRDFTHIIRFKIELSDYPMLELSHEYIENMGLSYEYIELSHEYIENMGLSDSINWKNMIII